MKIIVQKYGGTSLGTVERIKNVADRIIKWKKAGYNLIVVVSAMSGETNRLLNLSHKVAPTKSENSREFDVIASSGEQISIGLLALAIIERGFDAKSYTGWQIPIKTDGAYSKARIVEIDTKSVKNELSKNKIIIVAGFQGIDEDNNINTLGRGGSDTSAVAIAGAFNAEECQIFTDVNGVYTTDPRIEPQARKMSSITFEEMLEMASIGSKVLQIRAVEFAGNHKIKLRVLSSLTPSNIPIQVEKNSGTLITYEENNKMEQVSVSGIASKKDEAKVTVVGVPDQPGIATKILDPIAKANIEIDVIVQNVGTEGLTDFSFTVSRNDLSKTLEILEKVRTTINAKNILSDDKICKVGVVGIGMRSHVGVANEMFKTLADAEVNIQMISTSEIKITVVIEEKHMETAVKALHKTFNLNII